MPVFAVQFSLQVYTSVKISLKLYRVIFIVVSWPILRFTDLMLLV